MLSWRVSLHYPPNEQRDAGGEQRVRDAWRIVHHEGEHGPDDQHHDGGDQSEVHFVIDLHFPEGKLPRRSPMDGELRF